MVSPGGWYAVREVLGRAGFVAIRQQEPFTTSEIFCAEIAVPSSYREW